jgi:hypothetical protein
MTTRNRKGPLAIVLADPVLSAGLVELCRAGRVRAMGKPIIFRMTQVKPGLFDFEPESVDKYEPIPPDDWAALHLWESPEGTRLEGARKYAGSREGLSVVKGWNDVQFDEHDLRSFVEEGGTRSSAITRRQPRCNEKRPEIREAVTALREKPAWETAPMKVRCRLVEQYLGKPATWCNERTLSRAMQKG